MAIFHNLGVKFFNEAIQNHPKEIEGLLRQK